MKSIKISNNKERDKFCEKCKKEFGGEKIVGCEGNCACWFHVECSGLTNKQYQILDNCDAMKWFCKTCVIVQNATRLIEAETSASNDKVIISKADLNAIIQTAVKQVVSELIELNMFKTKEYVT